MRLQGLEKLTRAVRRFPRELNRELDDASQRIATIATREIRGAARTRAERRAAVAVRARGGSNPAIELTGGGGRAALMLPGTEWGGQARPTTQQFRPWLGGDDSGYFIQPTIRRRFDRWSDEWRDGLEDAARRAWR